MKFLKMYSRMDNHQLVGGIEKPFVDVKNIYKYSVENNVRTRNNERLGISVICETKSNVFYLAPPLDYEKDENEYNYLLLKNTDMDAIKDKEYLVRKFLSDIENFIPYLLKEIRSAPDGTIMEIRVEDGRWVIGEVE